MRVRRCVIAVSGAVVLLLALAWLRSHRTLDRIEYRDGSLHAPLDADAPPSPGFDAQWRFDVRTRAITHVDGVLSISSSIYSSFDESRDALSRWDDHRGWAYVRHTHDPSRVLVDHGPPRRFFSSLIEWRLLGLGVYSTGRMGERVRIIEAPYWFLILLAAAPGARALFIEHRILGRRARGECTRCGYPLPSGGRGAPCPECGATSLPPIGA